MSATKKDEANAYLHWLKDTEARRRLNDTADDLLEACQAVDAFYRALPDAGLVQGEIDFLNKVRTAINKATQGAQ